MSLEEKPSDANMELFDVEEIEIGSYPPSVTIRFKNGWALSVEGPGENVSKWKWK